MNSTVASAAEREAPFVEWADRWLASLERKPTTVDSYRSTIAHAKDTFGARRVRRIGADDIDRFHSILRDNGCSASTRAKHLRVLGACLQAAVFYRLADSNPVRELPPAQRPRPERKEAAYFENDELPRSSRTSRRAIPDAVPGRPQDRHATRGTARTSLVRRRSRAGCRACPAQLHRRQVGTPKNRERRDVDLISDVVELLASAGERAADQARASSSPDDSRGFLSPAVVLRRHLYPAMASGRHPRVGPTQEKRTFHSFRHTFAKRALESGAQITWLSRHLGHSSLKVTTDIYGHWERAERKLQAAKMEGAFPV